MNRAITRGQTRRTIRLVALPAEHGGWGFVLEPVLLGSLVAWSPAALPLGLAALAIFLIHQPLKLALSDRRGGKRYPRTVWAERFVLLYGAVAGAGALLALLTARAPFWVPIVLAVPFALLQAYYDTLRQSRQAVAELAGAVALGAAAPAIALAGGWPLLPALGLWAVLAIRSVTSILYVRARLRLERHEAIRQAPVLWVQLGGLLMVLAPAAFGVVSWLAVVAVAVLAARAGWGLSPWRRPARAPIVGMQEIGFGLLTVLLVAWGAALGW
jgi:hypothetical protein